MESKILKEVKTIIKKDKEYTKIVNSLFFSLFIVGLFIFFAPLGSLVSFILGGLLFLLIMAIPIVDYCHMNIFKETEMGGRKFTKL